MAKENAATALANLVEIVEAEFMPFFNDTLYLLMGLLSEFFQPEYKQFRGQVIEAVTIICNAVGIENFRPVAKDVIDVLI